MKVAVYSQWRKDAFVSARVKHFTKAAKLMRYDGFEAYVTTQDMVDLSSRDSQSNERQVVAVWLDSRATDNVAEGVA